MHDLRMPVQMMTGCAQMLREVLGDGDTEAGRYVDLMIRSGGRLMELLEELLQARRTAAEDPRMHFAAGDVAEITEGICETAAPYARTKGIALVWERPESPVRAVFDHQRYGRIVMNLLSNAIRFTPCGGCVRVALEARGAQIYLTVNDTGIGMPEHVLRRVFDGEITGGTGLSIVQKYAQLHGGRAYAARNLKGGMCFTVAFPAYLEDMAEKRPFAGGD